MTALECVSASGRVLPPLVILQGEGPFDPVSVPDDRECESWHYATSASGWSSNYLGFEWLKTVFLPSTRPTDDAERRLLIVDGHCSHQNGDFIAVCMENKVDLMILPPHTSHVTQPLDVGVFSSYKHHMRKLAGQDLRYSPNNRLPRAVWLSHLARARKNALTRSNILAGFRKAGISPFNREKLLKQARTPGESPPSIRRAPLA
jgi:hypothetical protein